MAHNILNPRLQSTLLAIVIGSSIQAGCHKRNTAEQKNIVVAAAADLGPPFEELAREYEKQTGTKVTLSFGSTGTLAKQIENGAPMDLFAAANIEFIDGLQQQGIIVPDTKALYARGRITLWTNADSKLKIDKLQDLTRAEVERVGIANPEHAPYGTAAREAMQRVGIWDQVKDKMIFAENVRMGLQYAETGNTEVSIVALSLSVQSKGHWV